ncbi:MAG: hypothetical protein ACOY3P_04790 [Planctomycetota bacterium]
MSMDPSYGSPGMAPEHRPGMSSGTKVLIVLGVVLGVCALLCCGGVIFSAFYMGRQFAKAMTTDPADIQRIAGEIATVEVPESLSPKAGMDMSVPFTGQPMMKMVVYGDAADRSTLLMMALDRSLSGQNEAQMREQMDVAMRQQGNDPKQIQIQESTTKEVEIGGQPTTFTISKGTNPDGKQRFLVQGSFEGRSGPTVFVLNADPEQISQEQAEQIIESIRVD